MKMPTYEETAKKLAEKVITEIEIEGKTIEQWVQEIVKLKEETDWVKTVDKLPPEGVWVDSKIDDGVMVRNHCKTKYDSGLWWLENGMYVYYKPTHWRYIENTKEVEY